MVSDSGDTLVVLDACVLLPAAVRDTLLRLAESPRMYRPRWSNEIWAEVTRNLAQRRALTPGQVAHLTRQVDINFPGARVEHDEGLIALMTNHPKDRHVAAAAVKSGAKLIVTYNLKDFPFPALSPWEIKAVHPDAFLLSLCNIDRVTVVSRLRAQAEGIGRTLPQLLRTLHSGVPVFADRIAKEIS